MTGSGKARWPTSSVIARAALFAAAGGALALAGAVATLAQGWEPTVSIGPAPSKAPARPLAAAKIKPTILPTTTVEIAPEPRTVPEDRRNVTPKAMRDSTASLETGSITGARPDEYCANIANPAADARFAWQTIDAAYAASGYGHVREGVGT